MDDQENEKRPAMPVNMLPWKILLLAVSVTGLVIYQSSKKDGQAVGTSEPETAPIGPPEELWEIEKRTNKIFTDTSPAVVHILSSSRGRDLWTRQSFEIERGAGSGFIWDEKGHVVTNYHVVDGADGWKVTLNDQTTWDAMLVGVAPDKDLAVLRIGAPQKSLKTLQVAVSRNLLVGQRVFAIGNPFGLDQTLTTGVISGLGREIRSNTNRPIQDVIQTDASINPGNSGGPLLNSAGKLIGVNTAIYSTSGSSAGVGFAIPADTVRRIIPQLIQFGRVMRPGLGVSVAPEYWMRRYGLTGLLVWGVQRDGSADRAGILPTRRTRDGSVILGDTIISIEGQAVSDQDDLYRILDRYQVGQTVKVTVRRQGTEKVLTAKLQSVE